MIVIFVGDKPSKYNKSPDIAFVGAKCERRLMSWIDYLTNDMSGSYQVINRIDRNFQAAIESADFVVALGNKASDALKGIPHFKLPHPSGLNRQVNNKEFIKSKLFECKNYLKQAQSKR